MNGITQQDTDPITASDKFKLKNRITDAEYQYLMLLKKLGQPTLGSVRFPSGEVKEIVK